MEMEGPVTFVSLCCFFAHICSRPSLLLITDWVPRQTEAAAEKAAAFFIWTLPNRSRQTVVVVKSGQDDLSQTLYSQKWPKSVFEIVVRIERKKISAVNVPNGVSDVPIGTSQFCRCCATIKSEKVSATNDRLLSLVHRMFTNT